MSSWFNVKNDRVLNKVENLPVDEREKADFILVGDGAGHFDVFKKPDDEVIEKVEDLQRFAARHSGKYIIVIYDDEDGGYGSPRGLPWNVL